MTQIAAFQAKTHLGQLLDQVEQGEEITITRHGKVVARLVPAVEAASAPDVAAAVAAMLEFRQGRAIGTEEMRDWVEEGRRY